MRTKKSAIGLTFSFVLTFFLLTGTGCNGSGSGGIAPTRSELVQEAEFITSGHADAGADAFNHWDEDDPPEVPVTCAKCHTTAGFLDFLGILGPTVRSVDNPVAIDPEADNAHDCDICHNAETFKWDTVTFPSGLTVVDLERESFCMECHQGRESTISVNNALSGFAEDEVEDSLRFLNIHYFAAAATRYGTEAKGGYEYTDRDYDGYFAHISTVDICMDCHNPHSLRFKIDVCAECHKGVGDVFTRQMIRMAGSTEDFDGDGDTTEGVYYEIDGLRNILYTSLQVYAGLNPGTDNIAYVDQYPFFTDESGSRYGTWTPRLLKGAYNYQYSIKDQCGYAHNAKYIIELLYDSIDDLNTGIAIFDAGSTIDMNNLARNDYGHFDTTSEAFRRWDGDGEVSGNCSRCHAPPTGFLYYLANFEDSPDPVPFSYGLTCETCHIGRNFSDEAPRRFVEKVVFPGGATIFNDPEDPDGSFLCMTCHQGRVSKATIDEAILAGNLAFQNVHYLGAGATLYGTLAQVGYEYDDREYKGKFEHDGGESARCSYCHEVTRERHKFIPRLKPECVECHEEADTLEDIRKEREDDYDGDGNSTEPLKEETQELAAALLARMQFYAETVIGPCIIYDPESYPYFFIDDNCNGILDTGENSFSNRYNEWDAELLKAAHNYQFSQSEPGGWAHNTEYVVQVLIDSIEKLGGDISSYTRP